MPDSEFAVVLSANDRSCHSTARNIVLRGALRPLEDSEMARGASGEGSAHIRLREYNHQRRNLSNSACSIAQALESLVNSLKRHMPCDMGLRGMALALAFAPCGDIAGSFVP
jgi:hypothetical protein